MKHASEIKKRIWKQGYIAIGWKVGFMLLLAMLLARNVEGIAIFAATTFVLISIDFTVNIRMSLQHIDEGIEQFGDKFVDDAIDLLEHRGDSKVYHQLLLTTYKDGAFEG